MNTNRLLISIVLMAMPLTAFSAGKPWYVGVSAGLSSLSPETNNSPFTLDTGISFGGGAFVGYDFGKRTSAELAFNYLGSATLSGVNGKTDIGYSAISGSGLMYVYGDTDDIAERSGIAGYVRLGFSSMNNSASIPLDRKDNVAIWAGVGVEWPFTHNLSLRGELATFDGDAQAAHLSVLYRPRNNSVSAALAPAPQPINAPVTSVEPVAPAAPVAPVAPPKPAPKVEAPAVTRLALAPSAKSDCAAPMPKEPLDEQGCAMFSGIVSGVEFVDGTATFTSAAMPGLDRLSERLVRYPTTIIEIQGHTESFGSAERANEIARQRTIAIARYLVSRGTPVRQLRARAFGHSRPLTTDDSDVGRGQNNRIEIRVLP